MGGGWLSKGNEISPCPCVEREKTGHFAGLCTTRQFADGGVSIPPRSAFVFGGRRDHEDVLENTMKLQENMITIRGKHTKSPGKRTKTERMLGTNHGKSLGKWRKPERMPGANHDDAVNMLEKYSESAGKCDNNERKWCKKDRKRKETGKTLGSILILKGMTMQETRGNGAKTHGGKR